jgi:glycosyltransferase involved in cell wall biosynthesis
MTVDRPRRVLILELGAVGHHPSYVRMLLDSGLANKAEIILASRREMFEHPALRDCRTAFVKHQIELSADTEAKLKDFSSAGLLKSSWIIGNLYRKAFYSISRSTSVDFVIVPYADYCLVGLAAPREAFGGVPWITITMRTTFHYSQMGVVAPQSWLKTTIRRLLFYRLLKQKSLVSVLTIDPTLSEFAAHQRNRTLKKIEYFADPIKLHAELPSRAQARRELGIPEDACVVLLYGEISYRKGVIALVDGAAQPACPEVVHVLIAGRKAETIRLTENASFQNLFAQGRIHDVDGYLDDAQERCVLASADCMWVGYIDFYGVSGVMALAGRHSIPVLGTQDGLIGYLTRKHEIGMTINPMERSSVVAALKRLVDEPEFFRRAGAHAAEVFERHQPSFFQQLVTAKAVRSWSSRAG